MGLIIMCSITTGICTSANAETTNKNTQNIVLAGGCFWGVQAVFQHTKGVVQAVSGYSGGKAETAHYEMVGSGTTNHAEAVQVTYDPQQVTLEQLLDIYFTVAHNPTQLNYQENDNGTQYRSAIFYSSPEQQKIAEAKIAELTKSKKFADPIVTTVNPLTKFYTAEAYHQNYASLHPTNPYIMSQDAPKVKNLEKTFPDLFVK